MKILINIFQVIVPISVIFIFIFFISWFAENFYGEVLGKEPCSLLEHFKNTIKFFKRFKIY